MLHSAAHYRRFETSRLIFKETFEARMEASQEAERPRDNTPITQKLEEMEKKYGEQAYRKVIQEQAQALMMDQAGEHTQSIVEASIARYMKVYGEARMEFNDTSRSLEKTYEKAEKTILKNTKQELSHLKASFEEAATLIKTEKETPPDVSNKREVDRHFESYLEALNEHYFKDSVRGGIEGGDWMKAEDFKNKMGLWVQQRLNILGKEKATGESHSIALKKEIGARYARYANFDHNPATISSVDLKMLNQRMPTEPDKIEVFLNQADAKVHSEKYRQFMGQMEDMRLMHPDIWKAQLHEFGKGVLKQVENDHTEEKFIAAVNEKIEPVKNYRKAKKAFLKHLQELTAQGITETHQFIDNFTSQVFESTVAPEKKMGKEYREDFTRNVDHEISILMSGEFTPPQETDRILVQFMRSDRKQREDMLANAAVRQPLLRAIVNSTQGYSAVFNEEFKDTAENAVNFRLVRLKALSILGEQAQGIVENYHKGLSNELKTTQVNRGDLRIDTAFKAPPQGQIRFHSNLERGGFNTRDLGLKAMKILGVVGIAINLAQGFSSSDKTKSLTERLIAAAQSSAANPGFLLAAGGVALAHKAEQDPRYLKLPWLSEYEKLDVSVADSLRKIASETSIQDRDRVLNNPVEWKVAKRLKENPTKFQALMELAASEKRIHKRVGISPELLVKAGVIDKVEDADLYHQLSQGTNRTRYLLYDHFLRDPNRNIHDIKEHCTGSSFI